MSKELGKDYFRFFYSLLNSTSRIAVVFDVKKKILFANDLFYEKFNTTKENTLNKNISSFIEFSEVKLNSVLLDLNSEESTRMNVYNEILKKKTNLEFFKYDFPEEDLYVLYIDNSLSELDEAHKTIKTELELVQSFFYIYREIVYLDLNNFNYIYLTPNNIKDSTFRYDGVLSNKNVDDFCKLVKKEYVQSVREFLDGATLKERLKEKPKINMEYESTEEGWCRIGFICCSYDKIGEPLNALFTFRNNNSDKLKELEIQRSFKDVYNSASDANRTKMDIISRIAHDIKTPINSLIGMAIVAQSNIDDKIKLNSTLKEIVSVSKKLSSIFNDVLDLSAIESGNISLSKNDINLVDFMTSLIHSNIDEIDLKKHNIVIDLSSIQHETIIGDSIRLQQVFNNILLNSIHYTKNEGNIRISLVEDSKSNESYVSKYVLTIEDDGIGMSKEFLERAFEPFERENRLHVRSIDGAGLGLAISKSFINKMGGDIKIESCLGKGTKVIVTFLAQTKDIDDKVFKNKINNLNILLISSNVPQLEVDNKIITSLGNSCEIAYSSKEAINLISQSFKKDSKFDLIIVSWLKNDEKERSIINDLVAEFGDKLPKVVVSNFDNAFDYNSINYVSGFIPQPLFTSNLNILINKLKGKRVDDDIKFVFRKDKEFKGKKVLIVEDNQLNLEVISNILGIYGMDTYFARNGKEAIDEFYKHEEYYFDAILMDIQMPVMNGYEATMAIRNGKRVDGKIIPIIAMSASAFADDINSAIIAGMDHSISKPINVNKLQTTLSKVFSGDYALRKSLELKAETDSFTKVLNKVAIFDRIQKYLNQKKVPLSALIVIDLDNFKNINDIYGHSVGDQAIKETAQLIRDLFRGDDLVGRYGGDEFIIFMKNVPDKDCVYKKANTIINKIRNKFQSRFDGCYLTASVGGAFVNKPTRVEKLFNEADKALYRVKFSGKNKIDIASGENVKE